MPPQPLDWDGLRYFLAAIATGTYSGAAKQLRVNRTTVARQIGALEKALDTTLFEQGAEGYQPNAAGRQVMEAARRIDMEIDALLQRLAGEEQSLQGPLRVAVPIGLGADFMAEIAQFTRSWQELIDQFDELRHWPPDSEPVQKLAETMAGYVDMFTAGDAETAAGLERMWSTDQAVPAAYRLADADLGRIMAEALTIYRQKRNE